MKYLSNLSRRTLGSIAAAAGIATTGYASLTLIKPGQFGLRDTFYSMTGDLLKPKLYVQVPFVQYTHKYESRTQAIEFNAGSCRFIPTCDSTADQNPLTARLVLQYKVQKDLQKINFHRWAMESWGTGRDGYWLLTEMLNTSANAILGQKHMADTLKNPEAFLKAVARDFAERIEQNNIPIEIESLELKGLETWFVPSRTVAYGVIGKMAPKP